VRLEADLAVQHPLAAMVQALRAGRYRVRTATGAQEAVEVATAEPGGIHLLLTAVIMPGDGGREVAQPVLAACPGVRVRKPFTPEFLRTRVREVLYRASAAGTRPAPVTG